MELTATDHHDRGDEQDRRIEQLNGEKMGESMQRTLDEVVDQLVKENDTVRDVVESLRKKVVQLK